MAWNYTLSQQTGTSHFTLSVQDTDGFGFLPQQREISFADIKSTGMKISTSVTYFDDTDAASFLSAELSSYFDADQIALNPQITLDLSGLEHDNLRLHIPHYSVHVRADKDSQAVDGITETMLGSHISTIIGTRNYDNIIGSALDETIIGGAGNDYLQGNSGDDILMGGGGNDLLIGANGADNLRGGAGNDKLVGGTGNDYLTGGDGQDKLNGGTGDDILIGGKSGDRLMGGKGVDTADYSASDEAVQVFLDAGIGRDGHAAGDRLVAIENVIGTSYDDTLTGDDNDNTLWGRAGNDSLNGSAGMDMLIGGDGNDTLHGGDGVWGDVLSGGNHDDTLYGGDGSDILAGDGGVDILQGDGGADIFILQFGQGTDTVNDFSIVQGDKLQVDTEFGTEQTLAGLGLTVTAGLTGAQLIHNGEVAMILTGIADGDITDARFDTYFDVI